MFRATIGFSAAHFQPSRANFFLAKLAEKYFLRKYSFESSLKSSLSEEAGLGAHGNVIVISISNREIWTERHFVWSHPATRPWGHDITQQCPNCLCLRPWEKPSIIGNEIVLACGVCHKSNTFSKPKDMISDGVMGKCGGGEWFFTRRVLQ